jgi:chloramphenicol-sensitive protein RarD
MSRDTRIGLLYTTGAFLLWGAVPVYWKMLREVPALEILAHRVAWALVFVVIWMTVRRRWHELVSVLHRPRTVAALLASTIFIAINWGLFVWAVNAGRVLSTSLGYYINPLVNVVLGFVVLHERLNHRQWMAVALATIAVALMTLHLGRLPWVSLVLAFSFAFYGLLRKTVHADAVVGLTFETSALAPLAVGYLVLLNSHGTGALGHSDPATDSLLVAAGAVTAVPLILFTLGIRRIPLSTAGLLQYIAPTCTFLLAVFLYDEPFTRTHAICFSLIWIALAIYTFDLRQRLRAAPVPTAAGGSQDVFLDPH